MRGRPRKPTQLKVIEGTFRQDRSNPREPQPRRKRPPCPPHLSADAKAAWRRYATLLDRLGVLTEADGAALAAFSEASADGKAAREALAARGARTYEAETAAGSVTYRPYPEVAMITDADRRLRTWLQVFGLTPIDRGRISKIEDKNEDPAAKFLR
jgi:P27 family predicted phage terminase small subunit